jgi:hypothetical protein
MKTMFSGAFGRASKPWALFLLLLLVGFGIRMGYGVVRYDGMLLSLSGPAFIASWDFDAAEHVLIAHALLSGKGYVVDQIPGTESKHVRFVGKEALFKAPLYQFFLAAMFALSGFSFLLFFPLQAAFGGLVSGFVGLLALEAFRRADAAWIAGLAAATHPVLVNSASQPYNENLFFLLFVSALWAFMRWFDTRRLSWASACGVLSGLCILTRESGIPLFVGMVAFGSFGVTHRPWGFRGLVTAVVLAALVVAPWTVRNYVRLGVVVPVASILGNSLAIGNNECVAAESVFMPFWSEGACRPLDERRRQLRARVAAEGPVEAVLWDRLDARLGLAFIEENRGAYLELCARRLWTALLPYNPRGEQRWHTRVALLVYWLLVFPAGFMGLALVLRRRVERPTLLAVEIGVNLLAIVAVFFWSDLRYRIGMDLLLGCFAGWQYAVLWGRGTREAL